MHKKISKFHQLQTDRFFLVTWKDGSAFQFGWTNWPKVRWQLHFRKYERTCRPHFSVPKPIVKTATKDVAGRNRLGLDSWDRDVHDHIYGRWNCHCHPWKPIVHVVKTNTRYWFHVCYLMTWWFCLEPDNCYFCHVMQALHCCEMTCMVGIVW
jgi:hypothetical protein